MSEEHIQWRDEEDRELRKAIVEVLNGPLHRRVNKEIRRCAHKRKINRCISDFFRKLEKACVDLLDELTQNVIEILRYELMMKERLATTKELKHYMIITFTRRVVFSKIYIVRRMGNEQMRNKVHPQDSLSNTLRIYDTITMNWCRVPLIYTLLPLITDFISREFPWVEVIAADEEEMKHIITELATLPSW